MTYDELTRLLQTAKERPVNEALIIRRGKRKGLLVAKVRPEVRAKLERLGWERALMYKTLVLTALRRGELEAQEVRHLKLERQATPPDPPRIAHEERRRGKPPADG